MKTVFVLALLVAVATAASVNNVSITTLFPNHVCLKSSYKSSNHASSSSYGHDDAHHALKDKLNIKLSCREKPSFVKFKRESKCLSRESFLNIDFFS